MAGFDSNTPTNMAFARFSQILNASGARKELASCGMPIPDPAGMPFSRVALDVGVAGLRLNAAALAQALRDGRPTIRVMEHALAQGRLVLELVPLRDDELRTIVTRVRDACTRSVSRSVRAGARQRYRGESIRLKPE